MFRRASSDITTAISVRRFAHNMMLQQNRSGNGASRFSAKNGAAPASSAQGTTHSTTLKSRWQGLPSFGAFHHNVRTTLAEGGGGGGHGSWWRRPVGWLIDHAGGLIAYQMLIETLVSGFFAGLLLNKTYTIEELRDALTASGIPGVDYVDWEGGIYTDGVHLPAALGIGGGSSSSPPALVMDATACTALHTAHNISMAFMPFELLFLAATYPVVRRVWPPLRRAAGRIPLIGFVFRPLGLPAEVLGAVNRSVGSHLGSASVAGAASSSSSSAAAAVRSGASLQSSSPKWRKK